MRQKQGTSALSTIVTELGQFLAMRNMILKFTTLKPRSFLMYKCLNSEI